MSTHTFTPRHYHTTLGSHPPVLHVKSGDTIVAITVDAAGQDSASTPITPPGNPMTECFTGALRESFRIFDDLSDPHFALSHHSR